MAFVRDPGVTEFVAPIVRRDDSGIGTCSDERFYN
jgi:hypothetical protein